jgi:Uri superfamily endonuclease
MSGQQFSIFGNKYHTGSYILFIRVSCPLQLAFGRFQHGRLINIPEGNYLYIGSALGGERSGSPLARRLIRHASRSGNSVAHHIRSAIIKLFSENNLTEKLCQAPLKKTVRWHIDYLLDREEAEISHIVIIRTKLNLELKLAEFLESLDETTILAPHLGAGDTRNSTHLLRLVNQEAVLDQLRAYIASITST